MEPYGKKEFQSLRVPKAVYGKAGRMEFHSIGFCRLLSYGLGWDQLRTYRIPGKILPVQKLVLFDLNSAFAITDSASDKTGADCSETMDTP